jgi:hypothetical protein
MHQRIFLDRIDVCSQPWDSETLISMCRTNDALIHESHQQMSQMLSTLEERQCEMSASMGFETLEPVIYPPLPPLAVEHSLAWYHSAGGEDEDEDKDDDDDVEI